MCVCVCVCVVSQPYDNHLIETFVVCRLPCIYTNFSNSGKDELHSFS